MRGLIPPCGTATRFMGGAHLRLWQREEKRRALAQLAFHPDLAAVVLHDVFDDGQTQTRAALLARPRLVHPVKPLEDAVE